MALCCFEHSDLVSKMKCHNPDSTLLSISVACANDDHFGFVQIEGETTVFFQRTGTNLDQHFSSADITEQSEDRGLHYYYY